MSSANVFSICIPKALPIDWREVKQIWFGQFPNDVVEQVDVVPYKSDHALAGHVKIFIHWRPQSDAALRMRAYCERNDKNEHMIHAREVKQLVPPVDPVTGEVKWVWVVEKWACSRSRVERKVRKQKDESAQVVEYAEPYNEVPLPPSSPPPSPTPSEF